MPHFFQACTIVFVVKDCSHAFMYSRTTSLFCIPRPVCPRNSSHHRDQFFCNGPKTPTSRGWSLCVVCGGKQNNSILFSTASSIILSVRCDPCPSKMRRILDPLLFLACAWGINVFSNHCVQSESLVHPFSDVPMLKILSRYFEISVGWNLT